LEQITSTAPPRRTTLHFSHIGFTDARTFIAPRIRIGKGGPPPQELGCGLKKQALRPTEKDSKAHFTEAPADRPIKGRSAACRAAIRQ
jgi:hypothetical protein